MIGFPLLIIPFAIYNVIAFMMPFDWSTKLYSFRLPSGLVFEPTASDAFILFSLLMLMFEVIKSTKHGKSLIEHFLALLLVCGAGAEFAMVNPAALMNQQNVPQQMGNSTFALLTLMFEVIKSTRHGRSIVEHFLVLLLACGAAAEFVLVKEVGNSIFMLFVAICFVDLFAGFAAALRRARRTVVVEQAPVVVAPAPAPAPAVRTEPVRVEPVTRVERSPFEQRPDPVMRTEPVQKIEP